MGKRWEKLRLDSPLHLLHFLICDILLLHFQSLDMVVLLFTWTYFIQYDSLYVYQCLSLQMESFWSFYDWVIFHCIYVPHLLYPFLCWWTVRLLLCPAYNSSAMNIGKNVSLWIIVFSGYMPSSGIVEWYASSIFVF